MRISDWSSDVCSSDLTASPGPSPSGRARPSVSTMCNEAGREKMAGRTKWMWLADGAAMVGAAAFAAQGGIGGGAGGEASPLVQLQIGKASCRERGCQMVKISVVAERIKKNKNKI